MVERHLIDLEDITQNQLDKIVKLASKIMSDPKSYSESCKGRIMATLFYEPSTRTQMSFQTAMQRLGGSTIGFDNPMNSSVAKGESLKDTIKIISGYTDIIAMRHPFQGSTKAATFCSYVPVINGGDGTHLHPTQTLTDIVTLNQEKGRLNNLRIGVCGDLKNGRTVHSLIKAMCKYNGNSFVLISTPELALPDYIKKDLDASGCDYHEFDSLAKGIKEIDVLYMTRIQEERFESPEEYQRQKGVFVLDKQKLEFARSDLAILHPLPRVDEITMEVDNDPRALYFKQAVYGMYGRMALIHTILNDNTFEMTAKREIFYTNEKCRNDSCITQREQYLYPGSYTDDSGKARCEFCDYVI